MNSKKYLSALLLVLTIAQAHARVYTESVSDGVGTVRVSDDDSLREIDGVPTMRVNDDNNFGNVNVLDSALALPGKAVQGATNRVAEPVDTILDEEEIIAAPQLYSDESNDVLKEDMLDEDEYASSELSDADMDDYNYNSYGYGDEDTMEAETDYDPELE